MVCIFVEVLKGKLPEIHTKMKMDNLVCKRVVILGNESSVNTYHSLYVKKGMYLCTDFFLKPSSKYIPNYKNVIWYVLLLMFLMNVRGKYIPN